MLPIIAIIGAANVGKSTLFNRLTRSHAALVGPIAGLTRDRHYGRALFGEQEVMLIDTGGFQPEEKDPLYNMMVQQARAAIEEAQVVLFVVDGRAGLSATDRIIASELRHITKPLLLVVNKIDGVDIHTALSEFYELGMGELVPIAAAQGMGIAKLTEQTQALIKQQDAALPEIEADANAIRLAIVGRPNVGKSTLVNRLLGYERVIAFDEPGTTRDSIYIPLERDDQRYILIDTAGMRRKSRITEAVEKFSVVKTLQAIDQAQVVLFVLDAREAISDQDLHILGAVLDAGRALVIVFNKWDGLSEEQKQHAKDEFLRRAQFVDFAEVYFISALHGSNVGLLWDAVGRAYHSATRQLSTAEVTRILQVAITKFQPPMVSGHRVKLRYAHAGGRNPPVIVLHGTQVTRLPKSYQRYLMRFFRDALQLTGTPLRLQLKNK